MFFEIIDSYLVFGNRASERNTLSANTPSIHISFEKTYLATESESTRNLNDHSSSVEAFVYRYKEPVK